MDASTLFNQELLSDVTVNTTDGKQILLHKVILMASSAVYRAMFSGEYKESTQRKINFPAPYDIAEPFFRMLYSLSDEKHQQQIASTLTSTKGVSSAWDLYKIAHQYQVSAIMDVANKFTTQKIVDMQDDQILLAAREASHYPDSALFCELMIQYCVRIKPLSTELQKQRIVDCNSEMLAKLLVNGILDVNRIAQLLAFWANAVSRDINCMFCLCEHFLKGFRSQPQAVICVHTSC